MVTVVEQRGEVSSKDGDEVIPEALSSYLYTTLLRSIINRSSSILTGYKIKNDGMLLVPYFLINGMKWEVKVPMCI